MYRISGDGMQKMVKALVNKNPKDGANLMFDLNADSGADIFEVSGVEGRT